MFEEKIKALTEDYNKKLEQRSTLLANAEKATEPDELKKIHGELRSLLDEINSSKDKLDELKDLQKEAGEQRSLLPTETSKHKDVEYRDLLNNFLHTRAVGDGLVSDDVGVTIPDATEYVPEHEIKSVVDLSNFVQKFKAPAASGKYPIVKRATAVLNTVEELEANPKLAKPEFTKVDWEVKTYRGAIPISRESIQDSKADLTGLVSTNAYEQKVNTTNAKISEVLKTFSPVEVGTENVDDIKKILNVSLDPAYQKVIIASQSFYQFLDTLKDGNGQYLLHAAITESSPARLLGVPVYVVGDDLLGVAGEAHAFIGDIKRAVIFADRLDIQVRWVDNEIFGQYLQAAIRFGVSKADEKAGYFVSVKAADAGAGAGE